MRSPYAWLDRMEGSALCRVSGAIPAAFLNRCAAAGVPVGDVEPESETQMRVTIPLRTLQRARRIALRSQCELTPLEESGARILARRLARRWVAAVGALAVFALLAWSKLYIWEIEVTGNKTVSAGTIRGVLCDCGVGIGTFWPDLVSDNLRSEVLVRLPQLAWVTVNIHGSRAEVIVRERIPKPAMLDPDEAVDLVAERTGFVTEVRALNGTALVKPGNAVLPGETLIAGGADSAFSGSREVHALGSVTAETYYELQAAAPAQAQVRTQTEKGKTRWAVLIGKKRVNFYRNSSICPDGCDKINTIWECRVRGLFTLPLALVRERYTPYVCTMQDRDKNTLRREMEALLHARLLAAVDGGAIEQETYTCSEAAGRLVVCLRARCSENIAKEQKK